MSMRALTGRKSHGLPQASVAVASVIAVLIVAGSVAVLVATLAFMAGWDW